MIELLRDGSYSDLTLLCDGEAFKVHRMILCSHSPIFKAQCHSAFSEGLSGEITIQAPTATAASVKRMLAFLYSSDYADPLFETVEDPNLPNKDTEEPANSETEHRAEQAIDQDPVEDIPDLIEGDSMPEEDEVVEYRSANAQDTICDCCDGWSSRTRPCESGHKRQLKLTERSCYTLAAHIHVYALGDYYQIGILKRVALAKFVSAFKDPHIRLDIAVIREVGLSIATKYSRGEKLTLVGTRAHWAR